MTRQASPCMTAVTARHTEAHSPVPDQPLALFPEALGTSVPVADAPELKEADPMALDTAPAAALALAVAVPFSPPVSILSMKSPPPFAHTNFVASIASCGSPRQRQHESIVSEICGQREGK